MIWPTRRARHAGPPRGRRLWKFLSYLAPLIVGVEFVWPDTWNLWVKTAIIASMVLASVRAPSKLAAIEERRAKEAGADELQAATTMAQDVTHTATNGMRPLGAALEGVARARRQEDRMRPLAKAKTTALVCALTLAARGPDAQSRGRACLYLWNGTQFVLDDSMGRSDAPRSAFLFEDVRAHEGFRIMFTQNIPQVDSTVGSGAETILGNPNAQYKSFVSGAILGSDREVYGFLSVDHEDQGGMEESDGQLLLTICQLLAVGLVADHAPHMRVADFESPECNTQPSAEARKATATEGGDA